MSLHEDREIACPGCGNKQPFRIWRSINVDQNPALKEELVSGELMAFTCRACGEKTHFPYPTLYHDMARQTMIALPFADMPDLPPPGSVPEMLAKATGLPPDAMPKPKPYTYRVVDSLQQLIEKVRLLEDGWDDRVMEALKLSYWHSRRAAGLSDKGVELLYHGQVTDDAGQTVMVFLHIDNEGEVSQYPVPLDERIARIKTIFETNLPIIDPPQDKWVRVDRAYAERLEREASRAARPWWQFWRKE